MSFNFRRDVALVTVVFDKPELFKHHLHALERYGCPDRHIIWLNTDNAELNDIAHTVPGATVFQSENFYDLPVYDRIAQMLDLPYLFGLPPDMRVLNHQWMDAYAGAIKKAQLIGIQGEHSANNMRTAFKRHDMRHARSGGFLVHVPTFLEVGGFTSKNDDFSQYHKVFGLPLFEVGLSMKLQQTGHNVAFLEPVPIFDYGHWGKRLRNDALSLDVNGLERFDQEFGIDETLYISTSMTTFSLQSKTRTPQEIHYT